MTEIASEIGHWIAEERARAGFTQEALAVEIGLDQASVSRIESGSRGLLLDEFAKVCAALEVPAPEVALIVQRMVQLAHRPRSIWERESDG